jgi:hypothetical protein
MTGVTGPTTADAGEPDWDALGARDAALAGLDDWDERDDCDDDCDDDWASAGATPSARAAAARTQVFNMSLSLLCGTRDPRPARRPEV